MNSIPIVRAWLMHIEADPMPAVMTLANAVDKIDFQKNRVYIVLPRIEINERKFKLVPIVVKAWIARTQQYEIHQYTSSPITPQPPTYLVTPSRPVIIYPAAIAQEAVHAIVNRD